MGHEPQWIREPDDTERLHRPCACHRTSQRCHPEWHDHYDRHTPQRTLQTSGRQWHNQLPRDVKPQRELLVPEWEWCSWAYIADQFHLRGAGIVHLWVDRYRLSGYIYRSSIRPNRSQGNNWQFATSAVDHPDHRGLDPSVSWGIAY